MLWRVHGEGGSRLANALLSLCPTACWEEAGAPRRAARARPGLACPASTPTDPACSRLASGGLEGAVPSFWNGLSCLADPSAPGLPPPEASSDSWSRFLLPLVLFHTVHIYGDFTENVGKRSRHKGESKYSP